MADVKEVGEQVVQAVRGMVQRVYDRLNSRIDIVSGEVKALAEDVDSRASSMRKELADAIASIPTPLKGDVGERGEKGDIGERGERGEKGDIGERGEKGDIGERGEKGDPGERGEKGEVGEKGDVGERGEKGDKGDSGERGEKGDVGERGEKGDPGERGERGEAGRDGSPGERGEKGDPGERGERGERGEKGDPGERGERGEKGDPGERGEKGEVGERGERGFAGERGEKGDPGLDGAHGRDALEITVLPSIDVSRSYPRGTFASYDGGLVRAVRKTDPVTGVLEDAGWQVVVDGIKDVSLEKTGEREFTITVVKTSGMARQLVTKTAFPVYRDVFKVSEKYEASDMVTSGGSVWMALKDNPEGKPGDVGADWKLVVKRGRDGKDGKDGSEGPRGLPGAPGKDLTSLGMDGRRY